jgi:hypothetical protein
VNHDWTNWPHARKGDEVKALFLDGKTYREIAALLGTTRSAIAGVCKRNGIREPDYAWRVRVRRAVYGKLPPKPKPERPVKTEPVAPNMRKLALVGLTRDVCHFPVGHPGEADFFFCGADATSTYCPFHHALTHRAPEDRGSRRPFLKTSRFVAMTQQRGGW